MARRMTPMQVELLREINKECDDDDSSTEYMIQMMQDAAEVSYDDKASVIRYNLFINEVITMYENYRETIKTLLEETFDVTCGKKRDYYTDYEMEEAEYISRDGFISHINGGFVVTRWLDLSLLSGSGYRFGVKEVDDKINSLIDRCYADAKEAFIDKHEEYKGRESEVEYHALYEAGGCNLSEELDVIEQEMLSEMSILCFFNVYYYDADNHHGTVKDKDSLYIFASVNYESPYHRHGSNNEVTFIEKSIEAKDSKDMLLQLAERAKATFDNIKD